MCNTLAGEIIRLKTECVVMYFNMFVLNMQMPKDTEDM